jgi:hypothetical protein
VVVGLAVGAALGAVVGVGFGSALVSTFQRGGHALSTPFELLHHSWQSQLAA